MGYSKNIKKKKLIKQLKSVEIYKYFYRNISVID